MPPNIRPLSLCTDEFVRGGLLNGEPFDKVDGTQLEAELQRRTSTAIRDTVSLVESFDSLVVDQYMAPEFGIRRRRFGRFRFESADQSLVSVPGAVFHQSKDVNCVFGGMEREFAPLEDHVRNSYLLREMIKLLLQKIARVTSDWLINVHQFRVETHGMPSSAAPEGVHRDGHDFLAIVAVKRFNISGGVSSVYDEDGNLLLETILSDRFACLLVNDRTTFHGVTPICPAAEGIGYRDVFVFDFNKARTIP